MKTLSILTALMRSLWLRICFTTALLLVAAQVGDVAAQTSDAPQLNLQLAPQPGTDQPQPQSAEPAQQQSPQKQVQQQQQSQPEQKQGQDGAKSSNGGAAGNQAAGKQEVIGDWVVQCQSPPNNPNVEACLAVQQVLSQENRPLMQIVVGFAGQQRQPVLLIELPLGVRLPPGVEFQIDQGQASRLPFERCMPGGCEVHLPLDDSTVAAMKAGQGGKVSFVTPNGQARALPISLKGFTAAYGKIK